MRILVFIFVVLTTVSAQAGERLLVFAAASQKDAMEELGQVYESRCQCDVVFSFAATSTLSRQVDAGAAADVIITANEAWADWLEIRERVKPGSRNIIAGNRLVIASAAPTKDSFNILQRGRFAMADPVSVPAGIYAREALETMGIWDEVRKNAVFSENVRVALSAVKRGDLAAGIVYASDLKLVPGLHAHYVFPEETHAPIHYVALAGKESLKGEDFVTFLSGDEAKNVFRKFGFLIDSATN